MSNAPNKPAGGKADAKNAAPDLTMIGPYKLISCIASGSNSQVWEALSADGQKRIAVKMLVGEALKDAEHIGAMKNEFNVGKLLDHPNIIKYFDGHWGTMFKKDAYFSMELFMAPNLKSQMFNNLNSVQLRFKRIAECAALAYQQIHDKGYLHRDIKPDNVLVNRSAEVKIIDLSLAARPAGALAKVFAPKSKTSKGTRSYMAPEQIMRKPLSFQVDMYSFGVMLFEMLTGQPPFTGTTPNDLLMRHIKEPCPAPSFFNSNVSEEMDRIVLRLLSKKPEQRQKSFNEFLAEFRKVEPFKEAIVESKELSDQEKAEKEVAATLGERLDSRTDALRTQLGVKTPHKKPSAKTAAAAKPAAPPAPAGAARPAPPQPAYPGQMAPGQMVSGQMMPGQPMYPMPPMYPMMPGGVPGQPQYLPGQPPVVPLPTGPTPWVAAQPPVVPQVPGGAPRPATPAVPRTAVPGPMAVPTAAPVTGQPVAPPAAAGTTPPAAARPAAPKPAPPKPAPRPAATKPAAPPEGIKIDDLLGFDDLPTA